MDSYVTEFNINRFLSQTGCVIYQRNGQRFCHPPKAMSEIKVPPKGHEVFVAKLPRNCYENEIYPVFLAAGDIYEIRLMMDFSGTNRGYCYVKYFTREAAELAVQLVNHAEIRPGHRLIVRKSAEKCTLTVYSVDEGVTEVAAAEELCTITENVTEVCIIGTGMLRQARIKFDSHLSAAKAMKKLAVSMQSVFGPYACIAWCPVSDKEFSEHKTLQMNLYASQMQELDKENRHLNYLSGDFSADAGRYNQQNSPFHSPYNTKNRYVQFVCSSPAEDDNDTGAWARDRKQHLFESMFTLSMDDTNKENTRPTNSTLSHGNHLKTVDNAAGAINASVKNKYTDTTGYFQSLWNSSLEENQTVDTSVLPSAEWDENRNLERIYRQSTNNSKEETITASPGCSYKPNVQDNTMFTSNLRGSMFTSRVQLYDDGDEEAEEEENDRVQYSTFF